MQPYQGPRHISDLTIKCQFVFWNNITWTEAHEKYQEEGNQKFRSGQ
jgi:hypothetical protein